MAFNETGRDSGWVEFGAVYGSTTPSDLGQTLRGRTGLVSPEDHVSYCTGQSSGETKESIHPTRNLNGGPQPPINCGVGISPHGNAPVKESTSSCRSFWMSSVAMSWEGLWFPMSLPPSLRNSSPPRSNVNRWMNPNG